MKIEEAFAEQAGEEVISYFEYPSFLEAIRRGKLSKDLMTIPKWALPDLSDRYTLMDPAFDLEHQLPRLQLKDSVAINE